MDEGAVVHGPDGWTRGGILRTAVAGGAVLAGGAAIGVTRPDGGASFAASAAMDAKILGVFLQIEQVQSAFYEAAVAKGNLTGALGRFATATAAQEKAHVDFLRGLLGGRASDAPETDFGDALDTPERFRDTAVEIEESAIAAYVAQVPSLRHRLRSPSRT